MMSRGRFSLGRFQFTTVRSGNRIGVGQVDAEKMPSGMHYSGYRHGDKSKTETFFTENFKASLWESLNSTFR